jgi:type IV pilus assembly protein PilO
MAAPGAPSALSKLPLAAKLGVGVFLVGMVTLAYWFIFYADVSKKIDAANEQAKKLKVDLGAQQQAQQSYFADRDELALRQQRARDFNKVLPADKQQPAFLSSVQAAAGTSGVNLTVYQPMDEQPQAFYVKDPMRLEVTGRFHQITKFMYEVGRLDRIINMENIELTEPKTQGDEVLLKGKCLATAFHTKPVAPAASGAPAPGAPAPGGPPAPGAPAPGAPAPPAPGGAPK